MPDDPGGAPGSAAWTEHVGVPYVETELDTAFRPRRRHERMADLLVGGGSCLALADESAAASSGAGSRADAAH
ncbi:hypothetical protein HBB16_15095 [Pseudonocardia sp. MCCB 268]|nr:hypothetical protein [Pseudonocardia cytotoxica]